MSACANQCLYPNCPCPRPVSDTVEQTISEKPTYQYQLDYLTSLGDSLMIKAIKENVIIVRNYEKATQSQS